jgi:Tol biopolymer transport system component
MTRVVMSRILLAASIGVLACGRGEGSRATPVSELVRHDSAGRLIDGAQLSPDGTRIAFSQVVNGGRNAIFVSALDGSNAVQLSNGVWDQTPVWSPDGKWIAYASEDPLFDAYVVASDGSVPPRQITSGPAADAPVYWLNDGSAVVVNRTNVGDEHPVAVPLNGGAERRLGPVMRGDLHGVWSPDGAYFGFDLHESGRNTIWVQDSAAGSAPRQLTTEGFENAGGTSQWSPDSRQIVYTSRRTGTLDIHVMDVATGQSRQLTNDIRDDLLPRWSPDGKWIAFVSDRGGQRDLWVMPSAGGEATRLTNDATREDVPRWTSDSRSVYYFTIQNAVALQLMAIADGTTRTLRAWDDFEIGSARLSPDGKTVLYDTPRIGNGDMFAISADGGEPTPFASSAQIEVAPRYSPDGSQIAFNSERGGSMDLWIVPAAGGEARNLTSAPGDEGEAVWSPDGTQVAFTSNRDVGGADLWVIPAAGGAARRLTTGDMRPVTVQWSPDGTSLFFSGQKPGATSGRDYFRVAATGGRPQPLGAIATIGAAQLSRDGKHVAYITFQRGTAIVHIMPAQGGPSRRVTADTVNVYEPAAEWAFGDSLLIVSHHDLPGNRDASDLWSFRLADGRWTQLTRTEGWEEVHAFTPDGKYALVTMQEPRSQIRRVSVMGIVGQP